MVLTPCFVSQLARPWFQLVQTLCVSCSGELHQIPTPNSGGECRHSSSRGEALEWVLGGGTHNRGFVRCKEKDPQQVRGVEEIRQGLA